MKKLWLLGVVLAAGSFAVGCGKSASEKAIEDAANQMQANQAKVDKMLEGAKDLSDKAFADAAKMQKDAAELADKVKAEGEKKTEEIKDTASDAVKKALEGVKQP